MTIEVFCNYIICLFSFSAGIMIISLTNRFGKTDKRKYILKSETKNVIRGLYYFSTALLVWTLSNFLRLYFLLDGQVIILLKQSILLVKRFHISSKHDRLN